MCGFKIELVYSFKPNKMLTDIDPQFVKNDRPTIWVISIFHNLMTATHNITWLKITHYLFYLRPQNRDSLMFNAHLFPNNCDWICKLKKLKRLKWSLAVKGLNILLP